MTRDVRTHIDDLPEDPSYVPRHLTKQEFGRRLYREILARGWNQSEMARQADLPRDSISTYVRGRAFPTPKSLRKIAYALKLNPADLLPNTVESAIDEDQPALEIKSSPAAPNMAWLRVNQLVRIDTATKIAEILGADRRDRDEAAHAG